MTAINKERWKRLLKELDAEHPPRDMSLYVAPARSSAAIIVDEIDIEPMANRKFLLVGARGGGKSTELRQVERRLAGSTTGVTVDLSATGVNLGHVSAFDLLYISGLALLQKLPEGDGGRQKLFESLTRAYGGQEADKLGDLKAALGGIVSFAQATALAATGVGLPGAGAAAAGAVTGVVREGLRLLSREARVVDHASPLGRTMQSACADIARAVRAIDSKKPLCVLIDGLEKINGEGDERFQEVFCYTHLLAATPWTAIIAAPPSTLTQTSAADAVGYHSHVVWGFAPSDGGVDTLSRLLRHRFQAAGIDPAHAVDDALLTRIAEHSGGLPRHAVRMAQFAVRAAIRDDAPRLLDPQVEAGIRQFAESLALGITSDDLNIMKRVSATQRLPGDARAARLFANGRILAHPPAPETRLPQFVVHPVLQSDVDAFAGAGSA